jgi:DNA-binding protein HU-beta
MAKAAKKTVKKTAPATTAKTAAPKKVVKKTAPKRDPKKPLTKSQIANEMAEKLELPRKKVMEIFETMSELAFAETKKTGAFLIPNIGKLKLVKRPARTYRNPQTQEPVKKPASKAVKFTVAKAAKDAINPPKA